MIARARVLVDSNVILDLLTRNPQWVAWSVRALAGQADVAELVINPLVYAELAGSFVRGADLDAYVARAGYVREDLPWEAAYAAGRAYVRYRRGGGERRSPIADFYIGAHAAVRGYALLTRDTARYATYFPSVPLIAP